MLLTATCPITYDGEFFARELQHEQTLENLDAFSDRLARVWQQIEERRREQEA